MSVDWKTYSLSARAAFGPGHGLIDFLKAHRTQPVRLDAAALDRVDTLLVQMLVAAGRDWAGRGLGFEVTGVGARLAADLAQIGLTGAHLTWRGAAA